MTKHPTESGSVSIWIVGLAPAFVAVLALIGDGGAAIAARQHAVAVAHEAAREGANQVDPQSTSRGYAPDSAAVESAVSTWLAAHGGEVSLVDVATDASGQVSVTVGQQVSPPVLGVLGVSDFHISVTSSARPALGDDAEWTGTT